MDQLIIPKLIFFFILITYLFDIVLIAALAERSPIIIQYSSNPSRRKDLDVRPYDRSTVQSASFKTRGQLYRGHVNAMALFGSPLVSALGFEWDDPGSSPGCGKALETCGKKKMRAPLLGLAKSICYCKEKFCLGLSWELKG